MTDLVERLRMPWDGSANCRQRRDEERAEAASRISQQDAEIERMRRELAEARKAAFIEAAEIIRARMPLYTEPQALNACRECISSIRAKAEETGR